MFGQLQNKSRDNTAYWLSWIQKCSGLRQTDFLCKAACPVTDAKSKPAVTSLMPMRSDERLAQRIAVEILSRYEAASILDIGCGDGVVSQFLPKGANYQGLDIVDACIYEQRHDNPNVQYIGSEKIPELMQAQGPWSAVLILDVLEHTRDFTGLFSLALKRSDGCVVVSLPNELFVLDRLRMLMGHELNAHSLDLVGGPEGFKHQYIVNIDKARQILSRIASLHGFSLVEEVQRPLIPKNPLLRIPLRVVRAFSSSQFWSMGSVFIYKKL